MELDQIMKFNNFVVVGNTINEEKYAYKIKHGLLEHGYSVRCVGKELASLNDVDFDIDIIDLCINPKIGLELLTENTKSIKGVVIQPGAESDDIAKFLHEKNIPFLESCVLVGLSLYAKDKNKIANLN